MSSNIKKSVFGRKTLIKLSIILLSSSMFLGSMNIAQPITWQKTYDGPGHYSDRAYSLTPADGNNFYAVGSTIISGYYHFIIKLNEFGDTLWTRSIQTNPPYGSFSYSSVSDGVGGCVLTGDNDTSFTMRIDKNGNIVWYKNYNMLYTQCFKIIRTNERGYIACGSKLVADYYGYVINIDSLGNLLWQKIVPSTELLSYNSITETGNSFLLAGTIMDAPIDTQQVLLTKIDQLGNTQWEKRYTVNGRNGNGAKILNFANKILIAGTTIDSTLPQGRGYFILTDTNGLLLRTKIFAATKSESLHDVLLLNDNKLLFSLLRDSANGLKISRVIVTDSIGNILQERSFIPPERRGYVEFAAIMRANNGDFIFGGYSQIDTNISHEDVYIARTDSLLYAPPIGIFVFAQNMPLEFSISQNYPNPFNPQTTIRFDVPKDEMVSVKIYDLLGREVYSISGYQTAGTHEVKFDGSNFASGMYFYSVETNGFKETKKMLLLK